MDFSAVRPMGPQTIVAPSLSSTNLSSAVSNGATATYSNRVDQVVAPFSAPQGNTLGEQDAFRQNPDQSRANGYVQAQDNRAKGVTAVMSYNIDNQRTFMEVKTSSGYKIASFPPEQLPSWLDQNLGQGSNGTNGVSQTT